MSHLPQLIPDLAVILVAAGIVTIIFKLLKQPVVLGYIVAGLLAGPAVKFIPTVGDSANIQTWADIGVIFLLFSLGLDFSFKKLMKVGGTAVIGAVTVLAGMMTLGYIAALSLGWGHMNGLFLGGMLSMSSTTIIFKAFDDMGLRNQRFAGVVFGVLIVEDLFAVLLMVLLSTIAVSQNFEGWLLLGNVVKLAVFLIVCFVVGIYLIPSILKAASRFLNEETLLIVSLGMCLGMVIIAYKAGFSAALGAFVMGSILAETVLAERIEHLIKPVKDLFGAVFFVSVGMLIDPTLLWEYKWVILLLTAVVMAGQVFFASTGIILSGQNLKTAVKSGFSLAQIGEFAFILASLGVSLHVTRHELYPIVVAVSVVTTFFTPYMIRLADPAYNFIERVMPAGWKQSLERYASGSNTIQQKSDWNNLLHSLLKIVGIYTVVTIVLISAWLNFVSPLIVEYLPKYLHVPDIVANCISLAVILLLISPMLLTIMTKKNGSPEFQRLWNDSKYNRGPLASIVILRVVLCIALVMIPVAHLLNTALGIIMAVVATAVAFIIFSRRLHKQSALMEQRFFTNLSARETENERTATINKQFANHLLERDLHLADFEVKPNSPSIGRALKELNFRQKCNINVVTIIRGDRRINIPGGDERLYPFDKLVVVGSDEDLNKFRQYVEERYRETKGASAEYKEVNMEQIYIGESSPLKGLTIAESGIRDKAGCLVIGIERGTESIKNPPPSMTIEHGDIVWVVGEYDKVRAVCN